MLIKICKTCLLQWEIIQQKSRIQSYINKVKHYFQAVVYRDNEQGFSCIQNKLWKIKLFLKETFIKPNAEILDIAKWVAWPSFCLNILLILILRCVPKIVCKGDKRGYYIHMECDQTVLLKIDEPCPVPPCFCQKAPTNKMQIGNVFQKKIERHSRTFPPNTSDNQHQCQ